MKKRITIYWLIPARPERELFRELIRILSEQYRAAVFKPHLTLCHASGKESNRKLLRDVGIEPIRLRVRGISHSSKFTKTLFVQFRLSESLRKLVSQLGSDPAALRDPHVSLLYKHLPEKTRRELAATIRLPFQEVTFDTVRAMSCVSPTETQADVKSWRTILTKRLSG
jgi:hypothetical protein